MPLHVRAAVAAEHLDQLGLLGPALQRVRDEELPAVLDALGPLRLRVGTVDPAGRLRGVASAEGRLVEQHDAPTALDNGVGSRHTSQTAANYHTLVGWKVGRHHLSKRVATPAR